MAVKDPAVLSRGVETPPSGEGLGACSGDFPRFSKQRLSLGGVAVVAFLIVCQIGSASLGLRTPRHLERAAKKALLFRDTVGDGSGQNDVVSGWVKRGQDSITFAVRTTPETALGSIYLAILVIVPGIDLERCNTPDGKYTGRLSWDHGFGPPTFYDCNARQAINDGIQASVDESRGLVTLTVKRALLWNKRRFAFVIWTSQPPLHTVGRDRVPDTGLLYYSATQSGRQHLQPLFVLSAARKGGYTDFRGVVIRALKDGAEVVISTTAGRREREIARNGQAPIRLMRGKFRTGTRFDIRIQKSGYFSCSYRLTVLGKRPWIAWSGTGC